MKTLLSILLLTGLVSCGSPDNFININVGKDGKNGSNGTNGTNGIDATSGLFYKGVRLGTVDVFFGNYANIVTSGSHQVQLSYSAGNDEWSLIRYSGNVVFYPNNACSGKGYTTRLHGRYGSDVIITELDDNQSHVAMVDYVNLYRDVVQNNGLIASARITGPNFSTCITSQQTVNNLKKVQDTVFVQNDGAISGWSSNNINLVAAHIEEK